MVRFDKKKFGFSMLEVTVTMLMVAIFTAASTNIFTQKHKKIAHHTSHGFFECYYDSVTGDLCQRMSQEGITQDPVCGITECSFRPLRASEFYVVNAIGGGGGGNTQGLGGSAGEYRSFFLSSISRELRITPGVAGIASETPTDGGDTEIRNTIGELLLISFGGKAGYKDIKSYTSKLQAGDIYACSLWFADDVSSLENCAYYNVDPYCTVNTASLSIQYCRSSYPYNRNLPVSEADANLMFFFDNEGQLYLQGDTSGTTNYMRNAGVRAYLHVKDELLNFNHTTAEDPSKMDEYMSALKQDNFKVTGMGIGGAGGTAATNGTPGAVLIVW